MPNAWFRFYSEFEDDPKVQMLSEANQRRLALLFCERCKEEKRTDEQRAFKWRISLEELAKTKVVFTAMGFIDKNWDVLHWNRRQFISDLSTERVRRHRSRLKQDETLPEQPQAVAETVPDTEAEADTDPEAERKAAEAKASPAPPSAPLKKLAGTLPLIDKTTFEIYSDKVADWRLAFPAIDGMVELRKFKQWLEANPANRKTRRGILRAIFTWLSRAQDRAGQRGFTNAGNKGNSKGDRNIDALAAAKGFRPADGSSDGHSNGAGRSGEPVVLANDGGGVVEGKPAAGVRSSAQDWEP